MSWDMITALLRLYSPDFTQELGLVFFRTKTAPNFQAEDYQPEPQEQHELLDSETPCTTGVP